MRKPTVRCLRWYFSTLLTAVAFVSACTTFPPPQPAEDLKSIAGKWEGWGTNFRAGRFQIKLSVKENGRWEMIIDPPYLTFGRNFTGTAMIREEKFKFETNTPGLSGTYTLHYLEGNRWLLFTSDDDDTRAQLRQSLR